MKRFSTVVAIGFLCMNVGWAIPSLQLDIAGGTYDSSSQTIIAPANPFTLYSVVDPSSISAGGTFYLSAAIVPKTSVGSFGSFTVNGTTYSSANMVYGNPPSLALENNDQLGSHGIYDTYYAEIAFQFDPNNTALSYNTADNPGGLTASSSGSLLYSAFTVDMTGLLDNYTVHFDLYNVKLDKQGNIEIDQFAPFSHDAQGGSRPVPDSSSTMVLLGIGMIALEGLRRRITSR
jgi:hypothetical protein